MAIEHGQGGQASIANSSTQRSGSSGSSSRSSGSKSSSGTSSSTGQSDSLYGSVHDLDRYERESTSPSYYSSSSHTYTSYLSDESTDTVRLARIQLNPEVSLAPMTIDLSAQKTKTPYKGEGKDPNVYDSNIRIKNSHEQPERSIEGQRVITAIVMINGAPAWTMFDTGSTADCMAPEFARVHNCQTFDLESPVPLQLGTKGSKSTITYGTNVEVKPTGTLTTVEYMDIINIDRYDAILGIPYMSKHGVMINLRTRTIHFADGSVIKSLDSEDEAKYKGHAAAPPQKYPNKGKAKEESVSIDKGNKQGKPLKENAKPKRKHEAGLGHENSQTRMVPKVLKVAESRTPQRTTMATRGEVSGTSTVRHPLDKPPHR
jgi:Retroviral aspartyl protease